MQLSSRSQVKDQKVLVLGLIAIPQMNDVRMTDPLEHFNLSLDSTGNFLFLFFPIVLAREQSRESRWVLFNRFHGNQVACRNVAAQENLSLLSLAKKTTRFVVRWC